MNMTRQQCISLYFACVITVSAGALPVAYLMWFLPDERLLLAVLGPPLLLYLWLGKQVGLGLPLLRIVFIGYFAVLFAPPALLARGSRKRFGCLIATVTIFHFVSGAWFLVINRGFSAQ